VFIRCKQGVHQTQHVSKRTVYPCGHQLKQVEIHNLEVPNVGPGTGTTHAYQLVYKHEMGTKSLEVPMLLVNLPVLYNNTRKYAKRVTRVDSLYDNTKKLYKIDRILNYVQENRELSVPKTVTGL